MSKPTIVLVHGAFADASSWDGVTRILQQRGYPVLAAANPLRGLHHDSAYLRAVLATIPGPVVLAGHSYGGAVITEAATGLNNVTTLVYVAAFAPEEGESAGALDAKYGGPATKISRPIPLPTPFGHVPGPDETPNIELIVDPAQFGTMFAPDVDAATAAALSVAQRPVALAALMETAGSPAWMSLPSYFGITTNDQMIPVHGQREMAARINATTVDIPTGHAAMLGRPELVADLITTAATDNNF